MPLISYYNPDSITTSAKPPTVLPQPSTHIVSKDFFIPMPPSELKLEGGPSDYYDLPKGITTWNDLLEQKAVNQWGAFSLHLKDVGKAFFRFGNKEGTSKAYDARKIIYSGLRILGMLEGRDAMKKELLRLLEDPQFK